MNLKVIVKKKKKKIQLWLKWTFIYLQHIVLRLWGLKCLKETVNSDKENLFL